MKSYQQYDQSILITIKEAARLTHTAEGTWRHWLMGQGEGMPPVRVIRLGRAVRIHRQDLLNWIDSGAVVSPRRRRGRPTKADSMRRTR
jgi:excisionase family DNA binding protein